MLRPVTLFLMQVVRRPSPFQTAILIPVLHHHLRIIQFLMAAIISIEVTQIHSIVLDCLIRVPTPKSIRQMAVNPIPGTFHHPVLILPLDQRTAVFIIVILAPAFSLLGFLQFVDILFGCFVIFSQFRARFRICLCLIIRYILCIKARLSCILCQFPCKAILSASANKLQPVIRIILEMIDFILRK